MTKAKIIFVPLSVLTGYLIGLMVWTLIIQPKNTRLAFHDILIASKNYGYNKPEQISSWLDELSGLEKEHLKSCEQIQYYNINAKFQRRLEQITDNPTLKLTSLQRVARNYTEELLSLEQLSQIGETEFSNIMSELKLFEKEIQNSGYSNSLNELAMRPTNFSSDLKEVELMYKALITKAENSFISRFYEYGVPKGTAKVIKRSHRFASYASYNRDGNSMMAYFDEETYNASIAAFISIHEMFPGHHLRSKANIDNLLCPGDNPTSFIWLDEGWATYAEFIAHEEGFFVKPEHKLAWLDYRLVRAMRIILDVKRMEGMKEFEPLKLMWDNRMPKRIQHGFDREFMRLERSHHQHTSYILGYQAILKVKTKLMDELGSDFEEKTFHDAILRLDNGEPSALYETMKVAMKLSNENAQDINNRTN